MKHRLAVPLEVSTTGGVHAVVVELLVARLRVEARTLVQLHEAAVPQLQNAIHAEIVMHFLQAATPLSLGEVAQVLDLVAGIHRLTLKRVQLVGLRPHAAPRVPILAAPRSARLATAFHELLVCGALQRLLRAPAGATHEFHELTARNLACHVAVREATRAQALRLVQHTEVATGERSARALAATTTPPRTRLAPRREHNFRREALPRVGRHVRAVDLQRFRAHWRRPPLARPHPLLVGAHTAPVVQLGRPERLVTLCPQADIPGQQLRVAEPGIVTCQRAVVAERSARSRCKRLSFGVEVGDLAVCARHKLVVPKRGVSLCRETHMSSQQLRVAEPGIVARQRVAAAERSARSCCRRLHFGVEVADFAVCARHKLVVPKRGVGLCGATHSISQQLGIARLALVKRRRPGVTTSRLRFTRGAQLLGQDLGVGEPAPIARLQPVVAAHAFASRRPRSRNRIRENISGTSAPWTRNGVVNSTHRCRLRRSAR